MKRVLLSIAIGFAFVSVYIGIMFTLFATHVVPSNKLDVPYSAPMMLPEVILRSVFGHSETLDLVRKHPLAIGLWYIFANTTLYSPLIYLFLRLIGLKKRKPVTSFTEPPPPPEF